MTEAKDGLRGLYLSGSMFAPVFRHNLDRNYSVGKRRCDSMGVSEPGGHLIRNYRPLGTLDENPGSIHRVIRSQLRLVARRRLIFLHDVDRRRLIRIEGAAHRLILRVNSGQNR